MKKTVCFDFEGQGNRKGALAKKMNAEHDVFEIISGEGEKTKKRLEFSARL